MQHTCYQESLKNMLAHQSILFRIQCAGEGQEQTNQLYGAVPDLSSISSQGIEKFSRFFIIADLAHEKLDSYIGIGSC